MSVLAIVLIVVGVLAVLLFIGGYVAARRRVEHQDFAADVARADQALEHARAADRGWNRQLLDDAARRALGVEKPGFDWDALELVLVDDRPGVEEDRAHVLARGGDEVVRVVLAREPDGSWIAESIHQ
jgi:type II secretory pathway pseudopilin PulG